MFHCFTFLHYYCYHKCCLKIHFVGSILIIPLPPLQLNQQASDEGESPSQVEKQRLMAENLHGRDINNQRILAYQNKAPLPPEVGVPCYILLSSIVTSNCKKFHQICSLVPVLGVVCGVISF